MGHRSDGLSEHLAIGFATHRPEHRPIHPRRTAFKIVVRVSMPGLPLMHNSLTVS